MVGSIHQDPELRQRFERSVALLEAPARSPEWLGGTTGLSISLGILASGGLQWVWTGGVGPILSVLGGVAGCLFWFQLLGRHQTGWMTRPAVLDSTRFSGAVTGAVLAVTYAVLSIFGGAGIASVEPHLPVGFGALAVLGFLIGAGIPIFTSSSLGYEAVDDDA